MTRTGSLVLRIMGAQLLVGLALIATIGTLAPRLLLADPEVAHATSDVSLLVGPPLLLIALVIVWTRVHRLRFLLRALALGSAAVEPEDVLELSRLPRFVVVVSMATALVGLVTALVGPFRPEPVDLDTSFALLLLGSVMSATAAMVAYAATRAAVSRTLEVVPTDVVRELLEREIAAGRRRDATLRRMQLAVVGPIGLVAFGTALLAHAHARRLDERARRETAEAIAHASLEPSPGPLPGAGRDDAIQAASGYGFATRFDARPGLYSLRHLADGSVSLRVPVEDGLASVRFAVTSLRIRVADVALALAAMAVAAWVGRWIGHALTVDLGAATARVRRLGTDDVIRGLTRVAPPVRFQAVARLNDAIEALAARFRTFAEAQERALESREATQRARSLLFASVSHDLRSPLNAIVGFAALLDASELTEAQRESVAVVERRARELLALIQTILDVARTEAGRLDLARAPVAVDDVIAEALRVGRALAGDRPADVEATVAPDLPRIDADLTRLAQALAALVGHALRLRPGGASTWPVRVSASRATRRDAILVSIHHAHGAAPPEDVDRLLRGEPLGDKRRRYGGLTLGLALARGIIELHGGSVRIARTGPATSVFRVRLPIPEPTG